MMDVIFALITILALFGVAIGTIIGDHKEIRQLEAKLFTAESRAAHLDESCRIMGDKLKQIAKERQKQSEEDPLDPITSISGVASVEVYDSGFGHTLDDKLTTLKTIFIKTKAGKEYKIFCYMIPVEEMEAK